MACGWSSWHRWPTRRWCRGRSQACWACAKRPAGPLLATLTDFLRARNLLLLLDNCEHLVEACAQLADALLRACPQVRILASSREALGVAGEAPFRVPSLAHARPAPLAGARSAGAV